MHVTPEQLAAYADGELDASQARDVEAQIACDAGLQAQLAGHHALKSRLAAHFAPIAEQPVPDRFREALTNPVPVSDVIDFADAARRKQDRSVLPRWTWIAGPALAASLAIALFGFGSRSGVPYADSQLADALDSQLVATQHPDAPLRILLSFRDATGRFCRGFSQAAQAGIACRDDRGWRLHRLIDIDKKQGSGEYRQAGSSEVQILAAIQDIAVGPALDADMEEAAVQHKWRNR